MAAPVLHDVLIRNALRALVLGGTFNRISYDANGVAASVDVTALPKEVNAYPVGSRFELDGHHGMDWRSRRSEWEWAVVAHWDSEVSLVPFEKARLETPSFIARDAANAIPQTELRFSKASYVVFPRGGAPLAPSALATFQPGTAALRARWTVHAVLVT